MNVNIAGEATFDCLAELPSEADAEELVRQLFAEHVRGVDAFGVSKTAIEVTGIGDPLPVFLGGPVTVAFRAYIRTVHADKGREPK